MVQPAESYNDIAHTALLTAYWRQFGGAPYATDIFVAAQDIWQQQGRPMPDLQPEKSIHGPTMEARQMAIDILIGQEGVTQVLDIGAGLSPHGLQLTAATSDMRYVELDLPIMSHLKREVLERLGTSALRENQYLESGSALDPQAVARAAQHLDPARKVAVVSEGLLHYLDNDERARVAENIGTVLRRFGGVWFTDMPHLPPGSAGASPEQRFHRLGTSRDVPALAFPSIAVARQFFIDRGFDIAADEAFAYNDPRVLARLISPSRLSLDLDTVVELQKRWFIHVLRLAEGA